MCKGLQVIRYYTLNFVKGGQHSKEQNMANSLFCFGLNFFETSDLSFSMENVFTLISGWMFSIFCWFSEFKKSLCLFDKLANSISSFWRSLSSYVNLFLNFWKINFFLFYLPDFFLHFQPILLLVLRYMKLKQLLVSV